MTRPTGARSGARVTSWNTSSSHGRPGAYWVVIEVRWSLSFSAAVTARTNESRASTPLAPSETAKTTSTSPRRSRGSTCSRGAVSRSAVMTSSCRKRGSSGGEPLVTEECCCDQRGGDVTGEPPVTAGDGNGGNQPGPVRRWLGNWAKEAPQAAGDGCDVVEGCDGCDGCDSARALGGLADQDVPQHRAGLDGDHALDQAQGVDRLVQL